MSERPKAAILQGNFGLATVYPPYLREEIRGVCDVVLEATTPDDLTIYTEELSKIELLFSSWGCPRLDAEALSLMPNLRAVFYAAGTIRGIVTDAFWERDIAISSSWAINALPVAEYTFAQIILSLKGAFAAQRATRQNRTPVSPQQRGRIGAYDATVGLVSLGQIGIGVANRLKALDVDVIAYDPFCSEEQARECGVRLVTIDEVFSQSDVVSLHTPLLDETRGMINGQLLRLMKLGATFINTSRGAVVNEPELIEVLRERPDLQALLDVVVTEPLPSDSPFYDLENVFYTPHIAGSLDREHARMGKVQIEECRRFLAGEPLHWQVTRQAMARMA